MKHDASLSRKSFLLLAGAALVPGPTASAAEGRKLLIVVAHPDDEYAFAATTYRLVREAGWTADQVVITDGEAGYRYSTLAEVFYGEALTDEVDGRARLPSIRKEEARRAGRILGIRHQYFLDQKDLGFDRDAAKADSTNWDRSRIRAFLADLVTREGYDVIFTLLPTPQTHEHHRAAALLALEAVAGIPAYRRPLIFGAEAHGKERAARRFSGLESSPLGGTTSPVPALQFDRTVSFGYQRSLDYQIVVNWVIAEHKSQGLLQMDSDKDDIEDFWLFAISGEDARRRLEELRLQLAAPAIHTAVRALTGAHP